MCYMFIRFAPWEEFLTPPRVLDLLSQFNMLCYLLLYIKSWISGWPATGAHPFDNILSTCFIQSHILQSNLVRGGEYSRAQIALFLEVHKCLVADVLRICCGCGILNLNCRLSQPRWRKEYATIILVGVELWARSCASTLVNVLQRVWTWIRRHKK